MSLLPSREGKIRPANYITHGVGFENVKREFERFLNPASGVIKAISEMP